MQLNAVTQPSWLDVFRVPMWHRCYQQLGSYGEVGAMTSKHLAHAYVGPSSRRCCIIGARLGGV